MNARRRLTGFAILGVWLATPAPAGAHRLDEYLQATRLSVDVERAGLEIDLTAGVAVASAIFAAIDTNDDGLVSDSESAAYARDVLRAVVLSVDGRSVPLVVNEIRVPPFREMRLGVGTIQLRATAHVAAGGGRHQISYRNTHRSESSVYLVNALVPADPRVRIDGQERDRAQHGMTLDYTVSGQPPWARTGSLLAALGVAAVLGVTRRRTVRSLKSDR